MTGLVEFITARLDEMEAVARAATPRVWEDGGGTVFVGHPMNEIVEYVYAQADLDHIVLNQPAAVLRDVEATRQLLTDLDTEKHVVVDDCWYTCPAATEEHDGDTTCNENTRGTGCDCGRDARVDSQRRVIASRWSTHPDYQQEWAP